MTSEKLSKYNKDQLIDIILVLNDTSNIKVRLKNAYAKQVEGLVVLLESDSLATLKSMSEKDEKKWERGRTVMKEITDYFDKLERLEERMIPVVKDAMRVTQFSSKNSIEEMMKASDG